MKKKIQYTDVPIEAMVVEDFLPSVDQLVVKEEKVKVTLQLSKQSVDFFKTAAKQKGVAYQTMIRSLIDRYVAMQ